MLHFCCMFRYDHRQLDLMTLREAGVRTLREVEEVIEGISVADRYFFEDINTEVLVFIGFTDKSKPLSIAVQTTDDVEFVPCEVWIPQVEVIVNNFCRYCYSTKYPNN